MISNEDYKNIRDSTNSELNLLYQYYIANFGMRLSAGAFMIKFQEWVNRRYRLQVGAATVLIVEYLDIKHEYQGFIENWR